MNQDRSRTTLASIACQVRYVRASYTRPPLALGA